MGVYKIFLAHRKRYRKPTGKTKIKNEESGTER